MGLDMYAYASSKSIDADVDFTPDENFVEEIHYWRKHPNLHGWMENLYREKGGKEVSFNVVNLKLTERDIDMLEQAVKHKLLPPTQGFFFGQSEEEDAIDDMLFIEKARRAMKEGKTVFYSSWW